MASQGTCFPSSSVAVLHQSETVLLSGPLFQLTEIEVLWFTVSHKLSSASSHFRHTLFIAIIPVLTVSDFDFFSIAYSNFLSLQPRSQLSFSFTPEGFELLAVLPFLVAIVFQSHVL